MFGFYSLTIFFTMLFDLALSIGVYFRTNSYSLVFAIISPFFCLLYVLILLGILDLVLRLLPKSFYDYKNKYFIVNKTELKFYEKLGVKKWKIKVPELGATGGFSKKHLSSLDTAYLQKFIYETCFGEILHLTGGILGFTCLLFFAPNRYFFVLPILVVNLILNLLPCIIQRYNRYKLVLVYNYRIKREQRNIVLDDIEQEDLNCNLG